jgi:hypothetical protein
VIDRAPPGVLGLGGPWIETANVADTNKASALNGHVVAFREARRLYGLQGHGALAGSLLVSTEDLQRLNAAITAQAAGQVTAFLVAVNPVPAELKASLPGDAWFNRGIVAVLSDHSVVFVGDCQQASTDLFARFARHHEAESSEVLLKRIVTQPNGTLADELRAFHPST